MRIFKQIEIFLCLCGVLFGSFCAPAAADAAVGEVTMSVEAFSIGCGYLVEPTRLSFYAGETDADLLLRLLRQNGLAAFYGGTTKAGFYLAYLADGDASAADAPDYRKSETPPNPRALGLRPAIPALLTPHLKRTMTYFAPDDAKNWPGLLGEFVFTNGSGWMYCVNNAFPNVGFADKKPADGEVVRVQFTLAYGADIGGAAAVGQLSGGSVGAFYAVADRDALTRQLCRAYALPQAERDALGQPLREALDAMAALDAKQSRVDAAANALSRALTTPAGQTTVSKPSAASGSTVSAVTGSTTSGTRPAQSSATAPAPTGQGKTAPDAATFRALAEGIIRWKKAQLGLAADENLLSGDFLASAGSTAGDWFPFALGRLCVSDDFAAYRAALREQVEARYRRPGKLSAAKATEWHRIALAVLATGGDPTAFGDDADGRPIDLIADGVYDRGKTTPLGRQGINAYLWGLLALDAAGCPVPTDAADTRETMLCEILRRQLPDGGFALQGTVADVDLTAMAVQALAPYYKENNAELTRAEAQAGRTVRQCVDAALACLSKLQEADGDFVSWGRRNAESTAQVIIALCCLSVDPLTDPRFVTPTGKTLLDGLLRYRQADGGFAHAYSFDPENPDAAPGQSNSMASEQALCALAALWRRAQGLSSLYDFRGAEKTSDTAIGSEADRAAAAARQAAIDALNADLLALPPLEKLSLRDRPRVRALLARYRALDEADRAQIENAQILEQAAAKLDGSLRALLVGIFACLAAVGLGVFLIFDLRRRRRARALRDADAFSPDDPDEGAHTE